MTAPKSGIYIAMSMGCVWISFKSQNAMHKLMRDVTFLCLVHIEIYDMAIGLSPVTPNALAKSPIAVL